MIVKTGSLEELTFYQNLDVLIHQVSLSEGKTFHAKETTHKVGVHKYWLQVLDSEDQSSTVPYPHSSSSGCYDALCRSSSLLLKALIFPDVRNATHWWYTARSLCRHCPLLGTWPLLCRQPICTDLLMQQLKVPLPQFRAVLKDPPQLQSLLWDLLRPLSQLDHTSSSLN